MSTSAVAAAAQPTGRTPRQVIERAVVEAITDHMMGSVMLTGRAALAKSIVDRITSAEYAQALRDVLERKPHSWNPSVGKR